jgi:hypothetical protein
MVKNLTKILCLFLLLGLSSCSKDSDDEFDDAVWKANFLMSSGTTTDCEAAITLLEGIGRDLNHKGYVQVLASAYACTGGYNALTLLTSDISNLTAGSTDFLNSIAYFSTSIVETTAQSDEFVDIFDGIEIVASAGGGTTHDERLAYFGADDTNDLNMQNLFMILAGLGKYLYYYGQASNVNGIKTQCLYTYTNAVAQAVIDGTASGACANPYTGTMSGSSSSTITGMCHGLVLYNQMMDTLLNTTISTSADLGDLDTVYTAISTAYDAFCASDANTVTLCAQMDLATCETTYAADNTYLQIFFATVFELTFL